MAEYLTLAITILGLCGTALGWWIMQIQKAINDSRNQVELQIRQHEKQVQKELDAMKMEANASKERLWKNIDDLRTTSDHLDRTLIEVSTNLKNLDKRVEEMVGLLKNHFKGGPSNV